MKIKYLLILLITTLCISACNRKVHQQRDLPVNDTTSLSVSPVDTVMWGDPNDTILLQKFQSMFQGDTVSSGSILGGGGGGTLEGTLSDVIGLGVSGSGVGGGGVATGSGGLGAAPSSKASRYDVLKEHFVTIATSSDQEEVMTHMMDVLEMCVSENTRVSIIDLSNGVDNPQKSILKIREYMNTLRDTQNFNDKIKSLSYNDEGKLKIIMLVR